MTCAHRWAIISGECSAGRARPGNTQPGAMSESGQSRRVSLLRLLAPGLLLVLLLLLVGCGVDTPQNTFAPEGDVADRQRDIFNLALWHRHWIEQRPMLPRLEAVGAADGPAGA